MEALWIVISVVALVVIAVLLLVTRGRPYRRPSNLAILGMAMVALGIIFGDDRLVGYSLHRRRSCSLGIRCYSRQTKQLIKVMLQRTHERADIPMRTPRIHAPWQLCYDSCSGDMILEVQRIGSTFGKERI